MWAQLLLLDVQGEVDRVGLPAKTSLRAAKVYVGKAQTIKVNDHHYSQLVVPTTSTTHFNNIQLIINNLHNMSVTVTVRGTASTLPVTTLPVNTIHTTRHHPSNITVNGT